MKILVMSDSHLYGNYLQNVLEHFKNQVDITIHCGDSSLKIDDPIMKKIDIAVLGNHDFDSYPKYTIYQNICVTHGHLYNVYYGYDELIKLCKENHCQICLHGHTHVPTIQHHQGITFINPGSLMMNRGSYGYGTFALIYIDNQNIDVKFLHHTTFDDCPESILIEGFELLDEFKQLVKDR